MSLDDTRAGAPLSEPVELDQAEHILLWAIRAIAIGRSDCAGLRHAFRDLCGPVGDEALTTLFVLVKQLAFRSRRRLRLHAPGCSGISGDELMLLAAVAAAQGPVRDGAILPEAPWLSQLIGAEADSSLIASARALAGLLARSGCRLIAGELRRPGAAALRPPEAEARVLH